MLIFKAFSALLSYPSAEMRQALPEIAEVVRSSKLVGARESETLLALVDEIGEGDLLAAEERYVDLFDRGRALSLHLFEHLHGDGRDRGAAMVELKGLYEAAANCRTTCRSCWNISASATWPKRARCSPTAPISFPPSPAR